MDAKEAVREITSAILQERDSFDKLVAIIQQAIDDAVSLQRVPRTHLAIATKFSLLATKITNLKVELAEKEKVVEEACEIMRRFTRVHGQTHYPDDLNCNHCRVNNFLTAHTPKPEPPESEGSQ